MSLPRLVLGCAGALALALGCPARGAEPLDGAVPPHADDRGSVTLRVGLATDLEWLRVPCCETVTVELGGARSSYSGAFEVRPGGAALDSTFRLQVAAVRDHGQAEGLARALERRTGAPGRVTFDIASGLYRVRVGRYDGREAAERARQRFAAHGLGSSWVVKEGGGVERPSLSIVAAGRSRAADGRWLVIEPEGRAGVLLEQGRYRGRVLVYLNDRGLLNLVNEISLEDYLRGVVPVEMGPELYDSLESLKAQAVAARTYTVRSLGGFDEEGFDLCASPRCQAYGGMGAEHPLSDRAVSETAGEIVLHGGRILEALYSASCGGVTENVEVVFPLKAGEPLVSVPCPERGVTRIGTGATPPGATYAATLLRAVAPTAGAAPGGSAAAHQAVVEALLERRGLPPTGDRLGSLDRTEVRRFLASALDLALDPRVLRDPAPDAIAGWSADERRLHARFQRSAGRAGLDQAELQEIELDVARVLGLVREDRAYFLYGEDGRVELRQGDAHRTVELGRGVATFARRGGVLSGSALELAPGDRLRLAWSGDRLLALGCDLESPAARPSPPLPWAVFRSEDELRRSVATLYPGFLLRDLQVLARGASGRIAELRLIGSDGDQVLLEGLAVRWTLGTPDTWFDPRRRSEGGRAGWSFEGRGRGHGVGLCQLGAVAMSRRGLGYKEILAHYYPGARLGRLQAVGAERASALGESGGLRSRLAAGAG